MDKYKAEQVLECLEGLMRQLINNSRPEHDKRARDDEDYRARFIELLSTIIVR